MIDKYKPLVYRVGNLLDVREGFIMHGCNMRGVMGAGVARMIADKYPSVLDFYRGQLVGCGTQLGDCLPYQVDRLHILNALTQKSTGTGLQVCYTAIHSAVRQAAKYAADVSGEGAGEVVIDTVPIGAGLGGGDWTVISRVLSHVSKECGVTFRINVYDPTEIPAFIEKDWYTNNGPLPIKEFKGDYLFLSNFFFEFNGLTNEHYYQAAKAAKRDDVAKIMGLFSAGDAKRMGRRIEMRPDWDDVKDEIMLSTLRRKFADNTLKTMLLQTGTAELIEGNTWGDRYWGVCEGQGENKLGKLLMQVRQEIRDKNPMII